MIRYSHHVVAARGFLNGTPTLLASLPAHVDQVFLHRLLLEVRLAVPNVWVPSAEGAGPAPAGPAGADVRELVHFARGDILAALAVAAEEFPFAGVVHLAVFEKLDDLCGKAASDLWVVEIHLPTAASWGPTLAVVTGVANELDEAVPAVAVGARRNFFSAFAANNAVYI